MKAGDLNKNIMDGKKTFKEEKKRYMKMITSKLDWTFALFMNLLVGYSCFSSIYL